MTAGTPSSPRPAYGEELVRSALEGLEEPVPAPPVPRSYRRRLAAVAAVTFLLPVLLVSAGFLLGLAAEMWLGWTSDWPDWSLYPFLIRWSPILALALAGLTLLEELVRLLWPRRPLGISLDRAEEPVFFAFVDGVAAAVGAPQPTTIQMTPDAEAAVGLRAPTPWAWGGQSVLYLGLTLPAQLEVRDLAGLLAHELGHLSQRVGTRFSWAALHLDGWLAAGPSTPGFIERLCLRATKAGFFGLPFFLAMAGMGLFRRLVHRLLAPLRSATSKLLHEMEYLSDRLEAEISGRLGFRRIADAVRRTELRMAKLSLQLEWFVARRAVPRDLTAFALGHPTGARVTWLPRSLPPEDDRSSFSHPSWAEREESLGELPERGRARCALPSVLLFREFDDLSRRATEALAREMLGPAFDPEVLKSGDELAAMERERDAAAGWMRRLSAGGFDPRRGVPDGGEAPSDEPEELLARIARDAPGARDARTRLDDLEEKLVAGLVEGEPVAELSAAAAREEETIDTFHAKLARALATAFAPGPVASEEETAAAAAKDAGALFAALTGLREPLALARRMAREKHVIGLLVQEAEAARRNPPASLVSRIEQEADDHLDHLRELLEQCSALPFALDRSEEVSLAEHWSLPPSEEYTPHSLEGCMQDSTIVLHRLLAYHEELAGKVAEAACRRLRAQGLDLPATPGDGGAGGEGDGAP